MPLLIQQPRAQRLRDDETLSGTHNPLLQVPDLLLGELDGLPDRGQHLGRRRRGLLHCRGGGRGGGGSGLNGHRLLLGGRGSRRLPGGLVVGVRGRHDGERGHDPCRGTEGRRGGAADAEELDLGQQERVRRSCWETAE